MSIECPPDDMAFNFAMQASGESNADRAEKFVAVAIVGSDGKLRQGCIEGVVAPGFDRDELVRAAADAVCWASTSLSGLGSAEWSSDNSGWSVGGQCVVGCAGVVDSQNIAWSIGQLYDNCLKGLLVLS